MEEKNLKEVVLKAGDRLERILETVQSKVTYEVRKAKDYIAYITPPHGYTSLCYDTGAGGTGGGGKKVLNGGTGGGGW